MSRVAILVDLGFFLPRYRSLIECESGPRHTAKQVATALFKTAERQVAREHGEQLYRIFVYDCKPLDKKAARHELSTRVRPRDKALKNQSWLRRDGANRSAKRPEAQGT